MCVRVYVPGYMYVPWLLFLFVYLSDFNFTICLGFIFVSCFFFLLLLFFVCFNPFTAITNGLWDLDSSITGRT